MNNTAELSTKKTSTLYCNKNNTNMWSNRRGTMILSLTLLIKLYNCEYSIFFPLEFVQAVLVGDISAEKKKK